MKLYMVLMEGIYIQDIVGIYDSLEKAKSVADEAKKREEDNYHSFIVFEGYMNGDEFEEVYKLQGRCS